ncbi:Transposon Ty3-I Gag-Pol polyprotein [Gossypium australe]|uniref:Transposon Ty3-I Gag-Pol polyprotein n=1 Tax=Gossypium australe TaxID=47621 RepID=A0A5B6W7D1_9ROSI|nr:Transposon Ty3-I Gag-Pol polyprotein [Gossypium australe]
MIEDPFLFKQCVDNIIRKCVARSEIDEILYHCHSSPSGGHFGGSHTTVKILQARFFWPIVFKDAHVYLKNCDRCQTTGNISRRNEMSLTNILKVELFDVWGIDFLCQFPSYVNRKIKGILENVVRPNRRDWSRRLDDALWAY